MIIKKKKGFGTYEMLTVCVMLLIIFVVLLAYVFRTDYKEKYKVMQYNAKMFALSTVNLYLEDSETDTYYLQMVIDSGVFSTMKNPFKGEKYCNSMTSKVVKGEDNQKYVTLECGNYLIMDQDFLEKKYTIYQTSKWSTNKDSKYNQNVMFYNYLEDGKEVFDEWLEEDMFLYQYNKMNGTSYDSIKAISDSEVVSKEMYRYLKKVYP